MRCQSLWKSVYPCSGTCEQIRPVNMHFWARDSLAVLQEILETPALADKCLWNPRRVTNADGERVYTDIGDSDWWWDMQVILCWNSIDIRGRCKVNWDGQVVLSFSLFCRRTKQSLVT